MQDTYAVHATKKGGAPLQLQRRKYGKTVTLLQAANVEGDRAQLLSDLKTALGTGGSIDNDSLEFQGSHVERMTEWLVSGGHLRGARKQSSKPVDSLPVPAPAPPVPPPGATLATNGSNKGLLHSSPPSLVKAGDGKVRSSAFGRFVALMKSWPFWDHDYSQLAYLFERDCEQREHERKHGSPLEGGTANGLVDALTTAAALGADVCARA